jgi:hypothetical protein
LNVFKQGWKSFNPQAYDQLVVNSSKSIVNYMLFLSIVFSFLDIVIQIKTYQKLGMGKSLLDFINFSVGNVFKLAILTLAFAFIGYIIARLTRLAIPFGSIAVIAFYSLSIQFVLEECTMLANVVLNIELHSYYSIVVAWLFFVFVMIRVSKQKKME